MWGAAFTLLLLGGSYATGRAIERRHFAALARRELGLRDQPVTNLSTPPRAVAVLDGELVSGCAVVSLDYFKRFMAGLRGIVGGPIRAYEPLLERGRREALLRMRELARERGYDMVINVRLETSVLANTGADGKGTGGVEMLAYGTALRTTPLSAGSSAAPAPTPR